MKNVVILISGRGTNMDAVIQAARAEHWDRQFGARVAVVVSNRPDAPGLAVAQALGVETAVVDGKRYVSREAYDAALAEEVDRHSPALVVLAGFMRILSPAFVERYEGRLINIHPSLLPAFPGMHTHRQALAAGVKVHGATVHFVNAALDGGPIIAQAAVAVHEDDDEERLAARVLAQEHQILPRAVAWFLGGVLRMRNGVVTLASHATQARFCDV